MNKKLIVSFIIIQLFSCGESSDAPSEEPYKPIQIDSDWFSVSYIDPKTYIIEESSSSQGNVSYMILGEKESLMIDTGSGENQSKNGYKIKHIVNQLTSLPTTLLMSHFHFDHNQNISEFSNVSFPNLAHLKQKVSLDSIYHFTTEDLFIGDYPSQVKVNKWLPINTDIDLGNRVIQLINIPGHTTESVAVVDKANKMAFLGDFIYNGTLFLFSKNDITIYKKSLEYLISIIDSDYKLYGAHGSPLIPFNKLEQLNNFLLCVLNKECSPIETQLWGYNVLIYNYKNLEILIFQ